MELEIVKIQIYIGISNTHNHIQILTLFHLFAKQIFVKHLLEEGHCFRQCRNSSGHHGLKNTPLWYLNINEWRKIQRKCISKLNYLLDNGKCSKENIKRKELDSDFIKKKKKRTRDKSLFPDLGTIKCSFKMSSIR